MKIKLVGAQEQWAAVVPLKSFIELFIVVLGGKQHQAMETGGKSCLGKAVGTVEARRGS